MKPGKSFFLTIVIVAVSLLILQLATDITLQHISPNSVHPNFGFLMGALDSTKHPAFSSLMISIAAAYLAFYIAFTALQRDLSVLFIFSFSLWYGGILGNLLDRIKNNYALDFIPMALMGHSFFFNYYDVAQWLGMICFLCFIISQKRHQRENNMRVLFLVGSKLEKKLLQLWFFYSIVLLFLFSCGATAFFYILVNHGARLSAAESKAYLESFLLLLFLLLGSLIVVTIPFLLRVSNRISGPIYSFEKWVDSLKTGSKLPYSARKDDFSEELERISKKIASLLSADKSDR